MSMEVMRSAEEEEEGEEGAEEEGAGTEDRCGDGAFLPDEEDGKVAAERLHTRQSPMLRTPPWRS